MLKNRFSGIAYLCCSIFLCVSFVNASLNKNIIKTYEQKQIGRGVFLNHIFNDFDARGVIRGFNISVIEKGDYYISAWAQGLSGTEWTMSIDGSPFGAGCVELQQDGWQAGKISGINARQIPRTFTLGSGEHTIVFRSKGTQVPDVEFIQLGKTETDASIDDTRFRKLFAAIKANTVNAGGSEDVSSEATAVPLVTDDPLYNYTGYVDKSYTYTYRAWYYFNAGTSVKFESKNGTVSNIIYLFQEYTPTTSTSWVGNNTVINATIPVTAWYILLIRAYYSGQTGTANLYRNNNLEASNCIVGGTYRYGTLSKPGVLNYFTANPKGGPNDKDTYLLLSTNYHGQPIAAYNDDYGQSCPSCFNWGWLSRIKYDLNGNGWPNPSNRACIIATAYSSSANGTCDQYLMCNNAEQAVLNAFPNLQADDGIKSANASDNYNCISWSGGRTTLGRWFWPPDQGCANNLWWDPDGDKASFDNFYGNVNRYGAQTKRWDNAQTFVPTSTISKAYVYLWSSTSTPPYDYTHGSVIKPADGWLHGYDSESKPGGLSRTFHPRDALGGSGGYGYIVEYYKLMGTLLSEGQLNSFIGSRDAETVLSDDETNKLMKQVASLGRVELSDLTKLYSDWKETWNSKELIKQSNPAEFFKSAAYSRFASFCTANKNTAAPFLMQRCLDGDYLAGRAIYVLGLTDNAKETMETTKTTSPHGKMDRDGYFLVDSEKCAWSRYIQNLIVTNY